MMGKLFGVIFERVTNGDINLYEIMVSAAHAWKSKVINDSHPDKFWKIDIKSAEQNLDVSPQKSKCTDDPSLLLNFGTDERMLRI